MRLDDRALIPLHGHQVVKSRDLISPLCLLPFCFPSSLSDLTRNWIER